MLTIHGVAAHPGYAKDKLVNAIRVMADFLSQLPGDMSPECTEDRQGYIHPYALEGGSEQVQVRIILRDFEMEGIEKQKAILDGIASDVRARHPEAAVELKYTESYRNMRYKIDPETAPYSIRCRSRETV